MGFLSDYLEFNDQNEIPEAYDLWSAISCLSAAVGYRVRIKFEQWEIRANTYVLLVGEAGNKKSSARDIASDLLHDALPDLVVSASCESRQGMLKFMDAPGQLRDYIDSDGKKVDYRPIAIFCSELANYISVDPAGMITFLTDIYDRKLYDYRLVGELRYLVNPYVVLLGCGIPDWLVSKIKTAEFCGGFGRRAIFVCDDSDVIKDKITMTTEGHLARARCVAWLRKLQDVSGEFHLDADAQKLVTDDRRLRQRNYPTNKFLLSRARSLHVLVRKIAMLVALSESTTDFVVHEHHIALATQMLNNAEGTLPMLTDIMGRGELSSPAQSILRFIESHGGAVLEVKIKKEFVLREFKNPYEYVQVMEHLKQAEQIIKTLVEGTDKVKRWIVSLPGRDLTKMNL